MYEIHHDQVFVILSKFNILKTENNVWKIKKKYLQLLLYLFQFIKKSTKSNVW